jgi:hypothetical protein
MGCSFPNGPGLSFADFVRLLVGALKHQRQEDAAECARLEWPTPQELRRRLEAAKGKAVKGSAAGTSTTSKRYLLLTHTTGVGRVSKQTKAAADAFGVLRALLAFIPSTSHLSLLPPTLRCTSLSLSAS